MNTTEYAISSAEAMEAFLEELKLVSYQFNLNKEIGDGEAPSPLALYYISKTWEIETEDEYVEYDPTDRDIAFVFGCSPASVAQSRAILKQVAFRHLGQYICQRLQWLERQKEKPTKYKKGVNFKGGMSLPMLKISDIRCKAKMPVEVPKPKPATAKKAQPEETATTLPLFK